MRLTKRIKKELTEPIEKYQAALLIIIGIVMGTIFTFGINHWESRITKDEARHVEAIFLSYQKVYRKHLTPNELILYFENYEQLTIDNICLNDSVINKVNAIEQGAMLQLCVHPNSNIVLEMLHNGEVIIEFDDAMHKLSTEAALFTILGVFAYLCAAFGVIKIIRKEIC